MSKLIKSLKQAVRYARGDKSQGKAYIVSVPDMTPDEQRIMHQQRSWRKQNGLSKRASE